MRCQPREVVDGLDQVGLALPVAAHERRRPGLEGDLDVGVGTEVVEHEV
jgi:hypothetical protein